MVRFTQVRPDSEVRTFSRAPTPNLDAARGNQPDQGATSNPNVSSSRSGAATNIQAINERVNAFRVNGETATTTPDIQESSQVEPNPLSRVDSLSFLWTLACLSKEQLANPSLYRTRFSEGQVVLSSAGQYDAERAEIFKGNKPEYFITDFKLRTVIANNERTGNTTAVAVDFTIFEPYSLGHLLESLNTAATRLGYSSYLNNTPFVLRLDIVGQNEDGSAVNVPPRFFPIRLASARFTTNESGSTYNVKGIPFNHIGFTDQIDQTFSDVLLAGSGNSTNDQVSVYEILADRENPNSLVSVINQKQEDISWDSATNKAKREQIRNRGYEPSGNVMLSASASTLAAKREELTALARRCIQSVPDQYEIYFAETASSWDRTGSAGDPSKVAINTTSTNTSSMPSGNYISDEPAFIFERDAATAFTIGEQESEYIFSSLGITTNFLTKSIQFSQGRTITDLITQVIIRSAFADNVVSKGKKYGAPPEFIPWFKIDVQVEFLEFDSLRQDFAKKITYRVVPYNVHQSFNSPDTTSQVTSAIRQRIKRRYEYIYTGQNTEVLDFRIEVNNLFYTRTQSSGDIANALADDKVIELVEREVSFRQPGNHSDTQASVSQEISRSNAAASQQSRVASNFMEILNSGSSADLIVVDLEILGDPWFLSDSGIGNYIEPAEQYSQETSLGKMNYEAGEVYIDITFRNPVDVNTAAGIDTVEFDQETERFSGIFRVVQCENIFSDGVFKQRLKCVRIAGQNNNQGNTNEREQVEEKR